MKNRIKSHFSNKKGMSLVEVLTAMTILSLAIFCFAPLFLTYLQSITIAGSRIDTINQHSATMQTVIGLGDSAGSYTTEVGNIPLSLQVESGTPITRKDKGNATLGDSFSATLGEDNLSEFKGNLLFSNLNVNEESIKDALITVTGNSQGSGLSYYPSSLTDDFRQATITLIADGGVKFMERDNKSVEEQMEIYISVAGNNTVLDDKEYEIRVISDEIVLIDFYGGGSVCFENSPITIKYAGYDCVIQIDAPMMIMVGEKAPNDEYYYYVSRGETEKNGDEEYLLIHRRQMNSTDESGTNKKGASGQTITLNSAMNDVEWVSAEDADALTWDADGNGKKDAGEEGYGYYVMCGDNGQIRRFWKNSVTGNYYWGGDYTYYSDIELDRTGTNTMSYGLDGEDHKNGMTYSTSVSYKYYAKRAQKTGSSADGYNLSVIGDGKGKLQSFNTFSVTSLADRDIYFYGSDGKLLTFNQYKDSSIMYPQELEPGLNNFSDVYNAFSSMKSKDDTYSFTKENGYADNNTVNQLHKMALVNFESYAWLKLDKDSYKDNFLKDVDSSIEEYSAPITLTSVGAIVLSGSGTGYYTGPTSDYNYEYTDAGATYADALKNYPTSTYTLYAGYIPAVMDIWSSQSSIGEGLNGVIDTNLTKYKFIDNPIKGNLTRKDSSIEGDSIKGIPHWKATIGITPYIDNTISSVTNVTDEPNATSLKIDNTAQDILHSSKAAADDCGDGKHNNLQAVYWPYTNINYAFTGKFYDSTVSESDALFENREILPWRNYSQKASTDNNPRQTSMSGGKVIDITVAYMSHPFATHAAMNPTDLIVFDQTNEKEMNKVFYWNNRRETITLLDVASTKVANGEDDIPVSLAVGYVMGGMAEIDTNNNNEIYPNTIMNNGIVLIRAGEADFGTQNSKNSKTGEYYAVDTVTEQTGVISSLLGNGFEFSSKQNAGFKLNAESNYFHQFYFLHTWSPDSDGKEPFRGTQNHIGDMYGARYWQNNRHIDLNVSLYGGKLFTEDPNGRINKYNYLRCHPLSNTKVTCVAWGNTWDGNPEAMWGTENGTVLSWWGDLKGAESVANGDDPSSYSERQVAAEIQSYKWIDSVSGKNFPTNTDKFGDTVGSQGETFHTNTPSGNFKTFFDKGSQSNSEISYSQVGFINTLENINDIEFSDDIWIAVGDQSDKDPDDYCANGVIDQKDADLKGENKHNKDIKAYSNSGSGSWVNVRYWVDLVDDDKNSQASDNSTYHWRAVKISDEKNCNIVQINNVNGMWIATGYIDGSNGGKKNDEYDEGEQACIFWTYDPLIPCDADGGWSSNVLLYDGKNPVNDGLSAMGGINSCATRTID